MLDLSMFDIAQRWMDTRPHWKHINDVKAETLKLYYLLMLANSQYPVVAITPVECSKQLRSHSSSIELSETWTRKWLGMYKTIVRIYKGVWVYFDSIHPIGLYSKLSCIAFGMLPVYLEHISAPILKNAWHEIAIISWNKDTPPCNKQRRQYKVL